MRTDLAGRIGVGAEQPLGDGLPEHDHLGARRRPARASAPARGASASCGSRRTPASCPSMTVSQLRSSLTTWPVVWTRGATNFTSATSALMARRSSQVSVGSVPAPALAPPAVLAPDETMRTLVPIEAKACSTRARAPSPIATMAMTAATPMMIPSAVRNERSLLRRSARPATRTTSPARIRPTVTAPPPGRAPPARPAWRGASVRRSSSMRPSRTTITRRAWAAMSGSCVTRTMVIPSSPSCCSSAIISRLACESRLPVGSSARMRRGRLTSARAIATRCCCPPDSWLGWWWRRSPRPTRSSASLRARAPLAPDAAPCRPAAARRSPAPSCAPAG